MVKTKIYRILASSLCALAAVIVGTASWGYVHQDETPAELLK